MEQQKLSFFAVEEAQGHSPVWKIVWQLLTNKQTKNFYHTIQQSHSLEFTLKTYIHTKTYSFIVYSSFIEIAKIWKQPSCPSVDKWINKLWSIQTTEHYPVQKKKKISYQTVKIYIKLKCPSLSERSYIENAIYYMIPIIWHSGKGKTMESVKRSVVARSGDQQGPGGRGQVVNGETQDL